ncbi:MAG: type II secretion system protein GspN [Deltaproteobacteria bacterium]|nr:type II secretion system protein GspN [Deltaproteobacteria bacterium]
MKTWQRRLLFGLGYGLLFLVSFTVFLYLSFPWDRTARYAEAAMAKALDMDVRIGSIAPSWFTGLELCDVTLRSRKPDRQGRLTTIHAERVVARASLGTVFGGDIDVDFVAEMMGGKIEGQFYRAQKDTRIVANLNGLSPDEVGFLREMVGLPIKGGLAGRLDLTLRDHRFSKAAGTIEVTARGVVVGDGKAMLKLKVKPQYAELQEFLNREDQGVVLPPMKVGTVTLKARVSQGAARITQLEASSEHIEFKGEGQLLLADPVTASTSAIYVMYKMSTVYESIDSETRAMMENMRTSPVYRRALRTDGFFGFCLSGVLRERVRPLPTRDGCPDHPVPEPVVPAAPGTPLVVGPPPTIVSALARPVDGPLGAAPACL